MNLLNLFRRNDQERKQNRRLLVFLYLLILSILVVGSMLSFKYFKSLERVVFINQNISNQFVNDLLRDAQNISSTAEEETCIVKDTITYYSYETPKGEPRNNIYGLYVYAEEEIFFDLAEDLVNSNGGDWGYVLIPYNVKDRDESKWNRVFRDLQKKHLIPIIQLHDIDTEDYENQTIEAARFLDLFLWPIRERYISVYNEPNDAKFWYNRVNPEEYARILDFTIDTFKEQNNDFFMMNGALNVSALSSETYMDAFEYMNKMDDEVNGIFSKLDGWASHSYPQPNFSGSPYNTGRNSIRAYDVELRHLRNNLGVNKDLPVFITETGWAHAGGRSYNSSFLPDIQVAEYFRVAFSEIWSKDERIMAVTPFTVRYNPPFDHFSWVNSDNVPYIQYDVVKSLEKNSGTPAYLHKNIVEVTSCTYE